jgi:hypothetical protein
MGKTYHKQSRKYDDDVSSGRSGNTTKHANNRKSGGMRTLNSYVEDDYEFNDNLELDDEIFIQHNTNTK